jgi:hypothetical protein
VMVCFTSAFAKKALRAAGYTVQCTYSLAEDRRTANNGDPIIERKMNSEYAQAEPS